MRRRIGRIASAPEVYIMFEGIVIKRWLIVDNSSQSMAQKLLRFSEKTLKKLLNSKFFGTRSIIVIEFKQKKSKVLLIYYFNVKYRGKLIT